MTDPHEARRRSVNDKHQYRQITECMERIDRDEDNLNELVTELYEQKLYWRESSDKFEDENRDLRMIVKERGEGMTGEGQDKIPEIPPYSIEIGQSAKGDWYCKSIKVRGDHIDDLAEELGKAKDAALRIVKEGGE